jgi:UDP-N-acetyl-D-mannosaminuronate dehydrogenase
MGKFIAQQAVKEMVRAGHGVFDSTVTVLGLTFMENCPDLRNSKVIDIIANSRFRNHRPGSRSARRSAGREE